MVIYMSKVYCGAGKVPKDSVAGGMKECARSKQIRRYGLFKIDKKTLGLSGALLSKYIKQRKKLLINIAKGRGRVRYIKGKLQAARGDKKIEAQNELDAAKRLLNTYIKDFNNLEKTKPK
jgi:hypothetical protein